MKLCKYCKHFEQNAFIENSKCNHPSLGHEVVSMLDGTTQTAYRIGNGFSDQDFKPFACSVRMFGYCGTEAVLFEPIQEVVAA